MIIMEKFGYHVSVAGGIDLSFGRAISIGCTTMQIFLSNPRGWEIRKIEDNEKERFSNELKKEMISPIFVHMPYLPNVASPKEDIRKKSVMAIKETVKRCDELGIEYVITHLGSHLGEGKQLGIRNAIDSINDASVSRRVKILIENEAGQKNSIGSDLEDVAEIYDGIGPGRNGICLDTCHLFAAGHDIRKPEVLDRIENIIGFENVPVLHLNDAKYELGSGKDRHENLGNGFIGKEGFDRFFSYGKTRGKSIIMETPEMPLDNWEAGEIKFLKGILSKNNIKDGFS